MEKQKISIARCEDEHLKIGNGKVEKIDLNEEGISDRAVLFFTSLFRCYVIGRQKPHQPRNKSHSVVHTQFKNSRR